MYKTKSSMRNTMPQRRIAGGGHSRPGTLYGRVAFRGGRENLSRILTFITFFQVRERMKTQFTLALVEGTRVPPGGAGPK